MADRLAFDDQASRQLEAVYLTPDIVEQRRVLLDALALRPGERVLDLGVGPGLLAAQMAEAVGAEGSVHGIDVSPSMLAMAAARHRAPGSGPVAVSPGDVGDLRFADASFDVAVCTQVYEYVAEMPQALAEARRVLRPGGRIAIIDTDWDSIVWRSDDDALMGRVMSVWDEHLAHPGLPRLLPELLAAAGFAVARSEVVPILNIGYREATYSAGMIGLVGDFVSGRGGISAGEAAAWQAALREMGDRYFFSLNRYLFVATA